MTTTNQASFATSLEVDDGFRVSTLTPLGRAAVSVVGVSGVQAQGVLRSCWTLANGDPSSLFENEWRPEFASRPFFGLFHFKNLDNVADEVVLRWRTPTSFELNCHGGFLAAERMVDCFVASGARRVSGAEWERDSANAEMRIADASFEAPRVAVLDSLFFDAVDELISATTTEVAARLACAQSNAWRQWFGGLARKAAARDAQGVVKAVDSVLSASLGRRLISPFVVALCGSPNVGKSSLFNAILGYERALTTPIPGTTVDLIGAPFVRYGWNYLLVDTAGFRETEGMVERLGIESAQREQACADVILQVYDPTLSRSAQLDVFQRFDRLPEFGARRVVLKVLNKCDLSPETWNDDWNDTTTCEMMKVSAHERIGLSELLDAVYRETVSREGRLEESDRSVKPLFWTEAQASYLKRLRETAFHGNILEIAAELESFLH